MKAVDEFVELPTRDAASPFLMPIEECFTVETNWCPESRRIYQ
jgi:translation elongation factor EF-Tu-like GTPase